jgi:prophage regulatory protein
MRLLSFPELKTEKGIKFTRQHIYRLVRQKKFPAPIKLGENTNAWNDSEIDEYLKDCFAKRDMKMASSG